MPKCSFHLCRKPETHYDEYVQQPGPTFLSKCQYDATKEHSAYGIQAFVERLFLENKKRIEEELIDEVYNFFEGHTWYVQLMFNELYILTGKGEVCDRSLQSIALTNILQMQDFTYQEIFSRLPEKQKEDPCGNSAPPSRKSAGCCRREVQA